MSTEEKKKQNRERVKASRDRKIAAMGKEAYQAEEKVKRELRRKAQKAFESKVQEVVETKEGIDPAILEAKNNKSNYKDLLDSLYRLKSDHYSNMVPVRTITKASVDIQLTKLLNLRSHITGNKNPLSLDYSFLDDKKDVLSFIDGYWKTPKSRVSQIQAIASILQVSPGIENLYEFYSNEATRRGNAIKNTTDDNLLSEKEKMNMLPWKDIKQLYKRIDDVYHKAIAGVYILIAPRRNQDYSMMSVVNKTPTDEKYNYLVVDANNIPKQMIFNVYKTAKYYGKQIIKVPKALQTVLKLYLDTFKIKSDMPLFPNTAGKHYKSISELVTNVFNQYTPNHLNINLLRHSYISDFLSKNPSTNAKKKLATAMGNSVEIQASYNRINL
jgi:hypothetical protein